MKKETAIYVGSADGFAKLRDDWPRKRWCVIGIFSEDSLADAIDIDRLGAVTDAVAYLQEQPLRVKYVLCALDASTVGVVDSLCHRCLEQGVKFYALPLALCRLRRRMNVAYAGHVPVLVPRRSPLSFWTNRMLKRSADILVSLLGLLTVFPLLYLAVAIRRKRRSPGPAIVREPYCGLNGRKFLAYRFRRPNDELFSRFDVTDSAASLVEETGFAASLVEETGFAASLVEEWPRIFNVFSGKMSLVGPRPHTPDEAEVYATLAGGCGPRYWAKPGLMEWVSASDDDSPQARVDDALWYQENWSFWLDLRIVFRHIFFGGKN